MYNSERVNVLQRCKLYALFSIQSSLDWDFTHRLIHQANDGLHHNSSAILLQLCYTRSQKIHSHILEMLQLTVSIYNGNGEVSF